ncbi:leucine ABC transporter subunit substrate-binding protein LivK [Ewingella americana]|uniref:Leucine ABC transporter subunit substrate-binding protein LivK n=1 Tax=Ewingella americana TaxID=41202 RepID=A0A377N6M0_9GAMM|nr:leucine ABC transporter subunit substrate-binding protein LivK [Ewingella americana]
MHRRHFIKAFALSATVVSMGLAWGAQAADTIKVGIMHSLSGTMAISETPLKDVALMTIDDINAHGGVLGKSSSRWWLTQRRTGRCSPKKPASC